MFVRNAKELFTRWLQSIQAIDVYPLKKYGKPLIAGMNGHKGSVAMYPVQDGYNSIQGMVLETVDVIKKLNVGNFAFTQFGDMLIDTFVDSNVLDTLSREWRNDLGLIDPDTEGTSDEASHNPDKEDFNQNVYNEIAAGYSNRGRHGNSLITKNRITSYDADGGKSKTYKYYEIKDVSPSGLITNEKVRNLYYLENDDTLQRAITDGKLVIAHNKAHNAYANIQFEHGNERIPVVVNSEKNIIDAPLVQEEVVYILQKLVTDDSLKGKIHFKSGARFNDTTLWKNTGFSFILEYQGFDNNLKKALDRVREETSYGSGKNKRYMFSFKEHSTTNDYGTEGGHGNRYVIIVYAPSQE